MLADEPRPALSRTERFGLAADSVSSGIKDIDRNRRFGSGGVQNSDAGEVLRVGRDVAEDHRGLRRIKEWRSRKEPFLFAIRKNEATGQFDAVARAGGRRCRCPNRGCMEAYSGGWSIAERAREAVDRDSAAGHALVTLAGSADKITAGTVAEANRDGDPLARRIVEETGQYLAAVGRRRRSKR